MYYYGSGYSQGGNTTCGCNQTYGYQAYPAYTYGYGNTNGFGTGAAIVLVLFILLVIIIGTRTINN